jgi:hypothetical protein
MVLIVCTTIFFPKKVRQPDGAGPHQCPVSYGSSGQWTNVRGDMLRHKMRSSIILETPYGRPREN